jgi:hypothetical protein
MPLKSFWPLLFINIIVCHVSCERKKQTFRVIYKHSDGITFKESEIISYKEGTSTIVQLLTNAKVVKERILTEGYGPIIPLFVKELDTLTQVQKCNVVDSYTTYVDDVMIKRVDRTCEWNGFTHLEYALFEDDK